MSPVPPVAAPEVRIEVCRCGCTGDEHATAAPSAPEPEWPLATAWAWLTRPAATPADADGDTDEALEDDAAPADLPWWDARASAAKRRAVLPLVLLGELQAGVLLRAVWEVVQSPGPQA